MKSKTFYISLILLQIIGLWYVLGDHLYLQTLRGARIEIIIGIVSIIVGFIGIRKIRGFAVSSIIIGFLSAFISIVVILSYNNEPTKPPSANIKAALANIRAQAKILYDNSSPQSYEMVCSDPFVKQLLDTVKKYGTDIKCFSSVDSFVVSAGFKKPTDQNTHFCTDSSGALKYLTREQASAISNANTPCL